MKSIENLKMKNSMKTKSMKKPIKKLTGCRN